jgi:hypothetical protein
MKLPDHNNPNHYFHRDTSDENSSRYSVQENSNHVFHRGSTNKKLENYDFLNSLSDQDTRIPKNIFQKSQDIDISKTQIREQPKQESELEVVPAKPSILRRKFQEISSPRSPDTIGSSEQIPQMKDGSRILSKTTLGKPSKPRALNNLMAKHDNNTSLMRKHPKHVHKMDLDLEHSDLDWQAFHLQAEHLRRKDFIDANKNFWPGGQMPGGDTENSLFFYPKKLKLSTRGITDTPFGIYDTSQYKFVKPRLIGYKFKTEPDDREDKGSDSMYGYGSDQSPSVLGNGNQSL